MRYAKAKKPKITRKPNTNMPQNLPVHHEMPSR